MPPSSVSLYLPTSSEDQEWGLYVAGVGSALVSRGQSYPAAGHPLGYDFDWEHGRRLEHFAVLHITKGAGTFESSHQPLVELRPGSTVLLFPGEWHRYRPHSSIGWQEFWAAFDGRIPRNWMRRNLLPLREPVLQFESQVSLSADFETLIQIARNQDPWLAPLLASHCHVLLAHTLVARKMSGTESQLRVTLQDAAHFLLTHPQPVDLPGLAHAYGLSYTNFRRTFLRQFGVSPGRYHRESRIHQAKRLLEETSLSMKQIADKLGFKDEFYFMQLFKRATGSTPGGWRRGMREAAP